MPPFIVNAKIVQTACMNACTHAVCANVLYCSTSLELSAPTWRLQEIGFLAIMS